MDLFFDTTLLIVGLFIVVRPASLALVNNMTFFFPAALPLVTKDKVYPAAKDSRLFQMV